MIQSLHIQNFKNLVYLRLPKLARVNLISGKNNLGKTTLLEAIRLYISDSQLTDILSSRGEILADLRPEATNEDMLKSNFNAISSLFTNRNSTIGPENTILITDGKSRMTIRFIYYIFQSFQNGTQTYQGIMPIDDPAGYRDEVYIGLEIMRNDKYSTRLPLVRSLKYQKYYLNDNKSKPAERLLCVNYNNYDNEAHTSRLWDAVTLTDKEAAVIKALQIIEPKVENLAFLEDSLSRNRYPVVKVKGLNGRVPLKSMGDGINHILSIILAIVNCENGCVMIDEIDNGLHYTIQKQLWSVIFDLAKSLNVQIFATTHSSDCISSFSKVLEDERYKEEGSFIRLELKNGQVAATEYSPEELEIVAAQNIEIR